VSALVATEYEMNACKQRLDEYMIVHILSQEIAKASKEDQNDIPMQRNDNGTCATPRIG
jgi:hypothetical protein